MLNLNPIITIIPILFLKRRMRKRRTSQQIWDGMVITAIGVDTWQDKSEIISIPIAQKKSKSNGKELDYWPLLSALCSGVLLISSSRLFGLFGPKKLKHLRHSLKVFSWVLKLQMDLLIMLLQLFLKMPTKFQSTALVIGSQMLIQ